MAWAAIDPEGNLAIGAAKAEFGLCEQIPGCNFSKDDEIWRLPLTWPGYVSFRCVWRSQPIDIMPLLADWADAKQDEIGRRMVDRQLLDAPADLAPQLMAMEDGGDLHLDPIQRGHVAWLDHWARAILGDPMGNGKTPPLIRAMQLMQARDEGLPALVICPDSAPLAWQRKLAAWAPELRTVIIGGTMKVRREALATEADVYIIAWPNVRQHTRLSAYPGMSFVRCNEHGGVMGKTAAQCEVHPKELNGLGIKLVIADEAHRMGNPKSKQARAAWWLAHHAEFFWAVTGTLQTSDVGSLWPVLHGLDPKAWPSRSRYLDLWAQVIHHPYGGSEVLDLRPEHAKYFRWAVDPYFRRIPLRTGRPERLAPEFMYPELSPAQARGYKQMKKEMLADLEGKTMVPDNDAVKFGRLVQLASSAVELVDGEDRHGFTVPQVKLKLPSNKAEALVEFLADNEGQWVVSCFSPQLVELCEGKLDELKIRHVKIVGGMSGSAKDAAAMEFTQQGGIRVCFVTTAGSESIDLYGRGVVFLQPNPSFVAREQIIGRSDRRGQVYPVRTVYMISPGTADERLYELGCQKEERHESVTRDAAMLRWVLGEGGGELSDPAGIVE